MRLNFTKEDIEAARKSLRTRPVKTVGEAADAVRALGALRTAEQSGAIPDDLVEKVLEHVPEERKASLSNEVEEWKTAREQRREKRKEARAAERKDVLADMVASRKEGREVRKKRSPEERKKFIEERKKKRRMRELRLAASLPPIADVKDDVEK